MSSVTHHIAGGLSAAQLDTIHRTALRVIEEIGVEVSHPEMLAAVTGRRGVRVDGKHVCFEAALVDGYAAEFTGRQAAAEPPDEWTIPVLSGYAFQVLDSRTDKLRSMSTADCIGAAKLVDALHPHGVVGGTPGLPQDVPVPLREITAYRIGCEHSRTVGAGDYTSAEAGEVMYRMAQAAGRPFYLPMFVLSPLRIEGNTVGMALEFLKRGMTFPIVITGMPLIGATAPIHLVGTFVEHVATVLATVTVLRLMDTRADLGFKFDVYPFDMKYGTIAYGTPEHIVAQLIGSQINRYYGFADWSCKAFHTNAVFPDAHSVAQRAAFAMASALNGHRVFTFGGMLGIDKIFSIEQLLVDVEIVSYVRAVVQGCRFDAEALSFDALREVGPAGDFITHESTVRNCRSKWTSGLFENLSPEQWALAGRRTVKEKLLARVGELETAEPFELPADVQRELNDIYESVRCHLA